MPDAASIAVRNLDSETLSAKLAYALLIERGPSTTKEIAKAMSVTVQGIHPHLRGLEADGYIQSDVRENSGPGRSPNVWTAVKPDDERPADMKTAVIRAMAERHYRRGLSVVTAKQIATDIGVNTQTVTAALRKLLAEPDPPVERVDDTGQNHYRLIGVGEYQTYRVGTRGEEAEA